MKIENAICWLIGKQDMGNEKITKLEEVSIEMPPTKMQGEKKMKIKTEQNNPKLG